MIETGKELAVAVKKIATSYKTLYVMGCFGAPLKATLNRKKRETPPVSAKVTGEVELRLLAENRQMGIPNGRLGCLLKRRLIESVSHSTVSSVLKAIPHNDCRADAQSAFSLDCPKRRRNTGVFQVVLSKTTEKMQAYARCCLKKMNVSLI